MPPPKLVEHRHFLELDVLIPAALPTQEKQRKNDDKLLDLELEIAPTRADVEMAKHQAEHTAAQAAEQSAMADQAVKAMDADRRKAFQDLQRCARADQHFAVHNQNLQQALTVHSQKHEALEAKLKDAERDKIRLRIDLNRLGDSKLELEEQLRERDGTKSAPEDDCIPREEVQAAIETLQAGMAAKMKSLCAQYEEKLEQMQDMAARCPSDWPRLADADRSGWQALADKLHGRSKRPPSAYFLWANSSRPGFWSALIQ